jgi:hypothetical protein
VTIVEPLPNVPEFAIGEPANSGVLPPLTMAMLTTLGS